MGRATLITHGDQSQAIAEMKFGNGLLVMAFFCNMEARAKPVNANLRVKVSDTDSDAYGTFPQYPPQALNGPEDLKPGSPKVSVTDSDANGTPPQGARLKPIEAEPKPDPSLTPMGEPETDPEAEPEPDSVKPSQTLEEMIKKVDEDGNGMVDVDEFIRAAKPPATSMVKVKAMKRVFKVLDKDGNGYISGEELSYLTSQGSKPKGKGSRFCLFICW